MPKNTTERRGFLQRFTNYFFERKVLTAVLATALVGYGILSYTVLLKRDGFPAINVPYAVAQGTYAVNDPSKVDAAVAKPLSNYLLTRPEVKSVKATSEANFMVVIVQYNEGVDSEKVSADITKTIQAKAILPSAAQLQIDPAKFGYTNRGDDAVVSLYSQDSTMVSAQALMKKAHELSKKFAMQKSPTIASIAPVEQFAEAKNPVDGSSVTIQQSYETLGQRVGGTTTFDPAVSIGFKAVQGADKLAFDADVQKLVDAYNTSNDGRYKTLLTASYGPGIRQQISELQKSLLEGLLAVLVIAAVVIAVRASLITVLSMVSVIAVTLGVLQVIGYTLNTITLFSLILGLSLIVDDTIIMVEALDAQRRKNTNRQKIVSTAVKKVGGAMIAATSTAALSFAPLLFVGGVMGDFIKAIPVTIISALLVSLLVALVIIPFLARYILLGKGQLGSHTKAELAAAYEAKVARFVSAPMLWAQHSRKKLALVCTAALLISIAFIGAAGSIGSKVKFNIFPSSKDSNIMSVMMRFPAGTDLAGAQKITDKANKILSREIGDSFVKSSYYGSANAQSASMYIDLTDYKDRKITSVELKQKVDKAFEQFNQAAVTTSVSDVGPPPAGVEVQIAADDNRPGAVLLAKDIAQYLQNNPIKRVDGSVIRFASVTAEDNKNYQRADGKSYVATTAAFEDTDTSALIVLTQDAIKKQFNAKKIASYGLAKDALQFDLGQEAENQDSFKTMVLAFPALLLAIYVLLAVQFRSLLQPLLIFMAIPFSLFGVTLGLWLSDNPFSFFAMLGFFALIGLSIKNTILLTDYANQARRAGMNPVDAAHEAVAERFRPLIATSLTAVVSLVPLAMSSPFWQGLAVVLMCGLLSSTFLVITVFPYFYLVGEYLRGITRRSWHRLRSHGK